MRRGGALSASPPAVAAQAASDSGYFNLADALALAPVLAPRPPPFLRRAHGGLRSSADGRWLPPPPAASVEVTLLHVEAATATVDGLSASILRATGRRVRPTIVGIPAVWSGGQGGAAAAATHVPAVPVGSGLPLGLNGQPLPMLVSASVDAGMTGRPARHAAPSEPIVPSLVGALRVVEHGGAAGGRPLARRGSSGGPVAVPAAAASSAGGSASGGGSAGELHLSCAVDDFDAWCDSKAEPVPSVTLPCDPPVDCPVILRVAASGYAPTRLMLRRRPLERSGPHHRLEGIVRISLRRLQEGEQPAGDPAGGRRLVSAAERRRGAVVVIARVVWKPPYITWPLTRGLSDKAHVFVKDEATSLRAGELPSQRMWRLSRHPISTMGVRVDVVATTGRGVEVLKNHRLDLACPLCATVVPLTGAAQSAVTALNTVLGHMDAEHVRVRVEVESHSFTRQGRGASGADGKGGLRQLFFFRASLRVALFDRYPTPPPRDFSFSRRQLVPVIGIAATAEGAVATQGLRQTPRRPRRSGLSSPLAPERPSPGVLPSTPPPAVDDRQVRARHRCGAAGGAAAAAAADAAQPPTIVAGGKRKRTPPAGLSGVRLYRAGINFPLSIEEALHGDLYDMSDVRWLERLDTERLLDVSDVTVREVYYMRLWNAFIRPSATGFCVYGDVHMRLALVAFVRRHRALLNRLSMWGLVMSHLHELYALGVIDSAGQLAVARACREPLKGGDGGAPAMVERGAVGTSAPVPRGSMAAMLVDGLCAAVGVGHAGGSPAAMGGNDGGAGPIESGLGNHGGLQAVVRELSGRGGARAPGTSGGAAISASRKRAMPPLPSDAMPPTTPTHSTARVASLVSLSSGGRSGGSSAMPTAPVSSGGAVLSFHAAARAGGAAHLFVDLTDTPHPAADTSVGTHATARVAGVDAPVCALPLGAASAAGPSATAHPESSSPVGMVEGRAVSHTGARARGPVSALRFSARPDAVVRPRPSPTPYGLAARGVHANEVIDLDAVPVVPTKRRRMGKGGTGGGSAVVATTPAHDAAALPRGGLAIHMDETHHERATALAPASGRPSPPASGKPPAGRGRAARAPARGTSAATRPSGGSSAGGSSAGAIGTIAQSAPPPAGREVAPRGAHLVADASAPTLSTAWTSGSARQRA